MSTMPETPTIVPTTLFDLGTEPSLGLELGWLGDDAEWAFTLGHVDAALLVSAAQAYCEPALPYRVEDVIHVWAVREVDPSPGEESGERFVWDGVTEGTPLAFPLTVLVCR